MKYDVVTTARFEKRYLSLDDDTKSRIKEQILKLESTQDLGKRLHGLLKGRRSLRVGEYRAVYEIYHDRKEVLLLNLDHRSKIYKQT